MKTYIAHFVNGVVKKFTASDWNSAMRKIIAYNPDIISVTTNDWISACHK